MHTLTSIQPNLGNGDTAGWRGKDAQWRGVVKELSVVEVTRQGELQRAVRARALVQRAKAARKIPVEACEVIYGKTRLNGTQRKLDKARQVEVKGLRK